MTAPGPELVELEQGTDAWLDWRDTRVTASEAAVAIGCAPSYWEVSTWEQLRKQKSGYRPAPDPLAAEMFAHGHRWEPIARNALSLYFGKLDRCRYEPRCYERGEYAASLDGFPVPVPDADPPPDEQPAVAWIEIKCPWRGWSSATARGIESDGPIPEHLWWQLVHQAGVLFGHRDPQDWPRGSAVLAALMPPAGWTAEHTLAGIAEPAGGRKLACRLVEEHMAVRLLPVAELLRAWRYKLEPKWRAYLAGRRGPGMLRAFP